MTVEDLPGVKDKVVLLLSCETAQQLGPSLIRAGAASFIGWKEDFVWVMDADQVTTPWKDKWAAPVILPVVGAHVRVIRPVEYERDAVGLRPGNPGVGCG